MKRWLALDSGEYDRPNWRGSRLLGWGNGACCWVRRWSASVVLPLLALAACTTRGEIEYPEVDLATPQIQLHVTDQRTGTLHQVRDRGRLDRDERETFPEQFPRAAFVPRVEARLQALTSQGPQPLDIEVSVQRADVTFFSHYRDEFVRYDVTLRVVTKARSGEVLNRGTTSAWRQLPKEKATPGSRLDAHVGAALDAFDQYFADEARLEQINENLAALEKTRRAQ